MHDDHAATNRNEEHRGSTTRQVTRQSRHAEVQTYSDGPARSRSERHLGEDMAATPPLTENRAFVGQAVTERLTVGQAVTVSGSQFAPQTTTTTRSRGSGT